MFTFLAYLIALLAFCSCQPNALTDTKTPADESGIFYRYFSKNLKNYADVPLEKGLDLLRDRRFDKNTWTIFYIGSWKENVNSDAAQAIVGAYLKYTPVNPVVFDWSAISTDPSYVSVSGAIEEVGTALGKQLCELFKSGLDSDYTELIGFQLGVHVAGQAGTTAMKFCGRSLRGIIGLDPGASLLYFPERIHRPMNRDDARQTIAIHTSVLEHGVFQRIAKAHIYVYSGKQFQPGCEDENIAGENCNANRSWQLFAAGLGQRKLFRATRADSYKEFADQTCEENAKKEEIYMGDENLEGTFYFSATGEPPYGKGDKGLCV